MVLPARRSLLKRRVWVVSFALLAALVINLHNSRISTMRILTSMDDLNFSYSESTVPFRTTSGNSDENTELWDTGNLEKGEIDEPFKETSEGFGTDRGTLNGVGKEISNGIDEAGTGLIFIDMLSVGSLSRPEYMDIQGQTMGKHPAVRNFFTVNELNDTESNCHTNLSAATIEHFVRDQCGTTMDKHPTLAKLKKLFSKGTNPNYLLRMSNPPGWLCAQKRPLDGLYSVLLDYKRRMQSSSRLESQSAANILPNYLFIMDDDTWINLDAVISYSHKHYPSDRPFVVAGCLHREDIDVHNFTFPWGGYSSLLTRSALQNLLRPVYCNGSGETLAFAKGTVPDETNDGFTDHFCWRLGRNQVGEQQFFREGMSVADLMFAYSSQQKFVDPSQWGSPGFCMHSDVALAYFINFYNIPSHSGNQAFLNVPEDRYRGFDGSVVYHADIRKYGHGIIQANNYECRHNSDENCPAEAKFCHHVTPQHMKRMHHALLG